MLAIKITLFNFLFLGNKNSTLREAAKNIFFWGGEGSLVFRGGGIMLTFLIFKGGGDTQQINYIYLGLEHGGSRQNI